MPSFLDHHHLVAFLTDAARLCAWLVLLAVVFLPLERLSALHLQKIFRRAVAIDLGYYFLCGLGVGLALAIPLSLVAWAAHGVVPDRLHETVGAWPLWLRALAGLVIGEIGFYWGHRWTHEIPFLWRFHSIHHSTEQLYFLASSRAHPLDMIFVRLCGLISVYILGLASPLTPSGNIVPALIMVISTMWGFFIHANLRWRLGPLEWVVSTPAFHHWHHTLPEPRDRNYASMLPWVDRIFGTHYLPRKQWPASYGIDTKLPDSLAAQLVHPFQARPRAGAAGAVTAE